MSEFYDDSKCSDNSYDTADFESILFFFGLHNCIFKKVGSVFYLYVTAMFLLLLWESLSSSSSSPQQSPMTAGSDR